MVQNLLVKDNDRFLTDNIDKANALHIFFQNQTIIDVDSKSHYLEYNELFETLDTRCN